MFTIYSLTEFCMPSYNGSSSQRNRELNKILARHKDILDYTIKVTYFPRSITIHLLEPTSKRLWCYSRLTQTSSHARHAGITDCSRKL